jgi:hypothetical protein
MQASKIITKVRRQIVESVAAFWQDDELLDLLNDAEIDFNDETRILEGIYQTDVIQGQYQYALPTNWLATRKIFYNDITDSGSINWRPLDPTNLEKKSQENPNFMSVDPTLQATVTQYWIWGNTLNLYPIPDQTTPDALVMFYKATPIPLTDASQDINLPDIFKDTITAYILWQAYTKEHEDTLAAKNEGLYRLGIRKGRRYVKKRSADQRYKLDIISPVGFSYGGNTSKGFNPFA